MCAVYADDVTSMVEKRTDDYSRQLEANAEERRALRLCGSPSNSSSAFQYHARVSCMGPIICSHQYRAWLDCRAKGSQDCGPWAESLMECLGNGVGRMEFMQ
jgi:hypothetical protein